MLAAFLSGGTSKALVRNLPVNLCDMSAIVLQGVPFDGKSSFLKGAAMAPEAIRAAYTSEASNFFAENLREVAPASFRDLGNLKIGTYFDIEKQTTATLRRGTPLISLGGDHSITYPLLKAFHRLYGPLEILHIDAHPDLYDKFEGDPHSHACPFARIMEEGLGSRLVQLGIRTLTAHQEAQAQRFKVEMLPMKAFRPGLLPKFRNPLYLSLDIDALDPAFAPGVSHQEPGGFTTREVLSIIQSIEAPILGADIVEYNPAKDVGQMTARVCAKFLKEIASKMMENKV